MIPRNDGPMDPGEYIRHLVASEPAYYARCDQLFAAYQDAIANGREPTPEEKHEMRRRKVVAGAQVVAAARRIVQAEYRHWRDEGPAA